MARNKYEIEGCVRYSARLHFRHARLYGRVRNAINLLTLLSGTAAFVVFFNGETAVGAVGSAIVVGLGLVDQVYDFSGKAAAHKMARRAFLALLTTMPQQTEEEFETAYRALDMETDVGELESLRNPSQNDVLREMGHRVDVVREGVMERFFRALS